jgi:hypothetical protein
MSNWSDQVLYPWIRWGDFLRDKCVSICDYLAEDKTILKFIPFVFTLILAVTPSLIIRYVIFPIPQTFEFLFGKLIEWIEDLIHKNSESHNAAGFILALFVVIPITFTYGLPKVIYQVIEKKRDKSLPTQPIVNCNPSPNRPQVKDFKPYKTLNKHDFKRANTGELKVKITYGTLDHHIRELERRRIMSSEYYRGNRNGNVSGWRTI